MTIISLKPMVAMLALIGGIGTDVTASQCGENVEARAIIDKAIEAHGGADKLSQFKAVSAKWVGKRKVENMFFWDAVYVVTYETPEVEDVH